MARPKEKYALLIVESYRPLSTAGLHGEIHIRPVKGQEPYTQDMQVQCSKKLSDLSVYPLGTKFRIRAKINDREGGNPFLSSHYSWPFDVVS